LQIDFTARFEKAASGNIASLDTLTIGCRYLITHAQLQVTQYGPAILVTLRLDPTDDVRVLLPNRFIDVFLESDIELINTGTRTYHLVSNGRYPNGRAYKLTLED
jgi:hypothetical protein